jgi:transcriptional regulator with XRE-family HTH domain
MTKAMHWTEQDTKKFQFAIALDFIDQLEARMAELKWSRTKLAKKAKVDKSYVSQVLNNPGNLSIETVVKFARALKLKVSVVAYDDGDESNERGPINADIFRLCWEHAKKPADMWSFKENTRSAP